MRQVPYYGIVGQGRLATHFCAYLTALGHPFVQWHRGAPESPENTLLAASHILLLISDEDIAHFFQAHPFLQEKTCIHCSGAHTIPGIFSAHPLYTFHAAPYTLPTYQQIPFVIEDSGPDFQALLPGFPNPAYRIPASQKSYYHALCVMMSNFPTLLWQHTFTQASEKLHLPAEIFHPIIRQALENTLANPDKALTGPLVRQDTQTIEANLNALSEDPFAAIYRAFYHVYQEIHHERTELST